MLQAMGESNEYGRQRRRWLHFGAATLAAAALPAGAGAGAGAADPPAADSAATLRTFVGLRARLDGQPVFTLARGTDKAISGGEAVPLRGQVIIQITRAIDLGGGAWELPYVEGTLTTEAATFRYRPELANPLTGETHPVAPPAGFFLARLAMDRNGILSNHVETPGGTVIDYSGKVAAEAGLEGHPWATQSLRIRIARPGADVEEAFVTTTQMPSGTARGGFLPSDAMSTSLRPKLPAALGGGRVGSLVSSYYGRKYATLDALRRALDPGHAPLFAPLFEQWRSLLP
jgi:hypothetical protein